MNDHAHKEWKRFAWTAALELSEQPGLGNLPQMLKEAMSPRAIFMTSTDAP